MKWYRVFARSDVLPAPAVLAGAEGVAVSRYGADEDGIRAELNSWAAFLETCDESPRQRELMERAIQARQLFLLEEPSPEARPLCVGLSRRLAALTGGFYQVDDEGFFSADGTLLVAEP